MESRGVIQQVKLARSNNSTPLVELHQEITQRKNLIVSEQLGLRVIFFPATVTNQNLNHDQNPQFLSERDSTNKGNVTVADIHI